MTAQQLITRVRGKVDEATATFWTDSVILDQLNESLKYYWAFIIKDFENYFAKQVLIDWVASNTDGAYALPSDFGKCRLLSRVLSNSYVPLKYFERYEGAVDNSMANSTYALPNYRFQGSNIKLEPAPNFDETGAMLLEYIRTLPAIVLGSVTPPVTAVDVDAEFAAIPMAEDCVVVRAVCKCKGIEEMVAGGGADIDPFIKDLMSTEQMMKELLEKRTMARMYVEQFGEDDATWEHTFL